jgi:FixJ family two-component response regulator
MSDSKQGDPRIEPTRDERVFVVDDDEQVRTSIAQLCRSVGLEVSTFGSADEFLEDCDPTNPGCLITDVRMPGMSGLELQQLLRETAITLPVIVITGYAEVPVAVQALKDGAFDFVQKPYSPQALLETIQRALDKDTRERQQQEQFIAIDLRLASLSPRETEVLGLLVTGKSTKEIAATLEISLTTVDFHRNNILQKTEVDNVVKLTRMVSLYETLRQEGDDDR